ncbi:diaminobutyrate--2-oxoglutarate transaminase [Ruminococcaceae bacterium OttesenSCG-928-A11]|nr:diaminobutyrate--2-oxoglutarate transaminase [Ruminococcaceae bacterium OttesenSCG-928-A11]
MNKNARLDYIYDHESDVSSYDRTFPVVFDTAKNAKLRDENGEEYIDFFAGAGGLNYGHNDDSVKETLQREVGRDSIIHGLDMATVARHDFMKAFEEKILEPRGLDYKIQFTSPSGANAVEAALKLARQHTGRKQIVAFDHGYHGLSLGALATTSNPWFREAAGTDLPDVDFLTYNDEKSLDQIKEINPAAIILEAIQGEGGVNVANDEWLQELRKVTEENDILMIIDDIQAGCGRSGQFFSFEQAGIKPDIVTLSKSLSGSGLPMSIVLNRPEVDETWKKAQHTGTFRGNGLAFSTATAVIDKFWGDSEKTAQFENEIKEKGEIVRNKLGQIALEHSDLGLTIKGRGMMNGLEFSDPADAEQVAKECFANNLVIERAGPNDEVLKVMPPLTIEHEVLDEGMQIIANSVDTVGKK